MEVKMKNTLEIAITLIMVASFIIFRIHIWRIRKNYNNFIIKQQEGKNESDLIDVVNNLHKLFEVQEASQAEYFMLILLTLIVIVIQNKGGLI